MKKWMVIVGIGMVLTILCTFLLIPSKIAISKITESTATISSEIRAISSEDSWENWWRDENGKPHEKGKPFTYKNTVFKLTRHENKAIGIQIDDRGLTVNSLLTLVSFSNDSTLALWQCEIPAGNNPLSRVIKYRQAYAIRKNMVAVMQIFKNFISVPINIYGVDIQRETMNDTLLLSTKFKTKSYPTTPEIYQHLDLLKKNIEKQKATVTGFPLLHVNKTPDGTYETQVALPTSLWLQDDGDYFSRRMVKGYFMVTEVKGGSSSVGVATDALENFIADHNKTKIAIYFQMLVTNRMTEQDSSKWVTRIFMPVVE